MSKKAENRPNIFQEIAKQCRVSPASVSLALQDSKRISEDTKYRVFLAARELGYRRSKVRGTRHMQFAIFHGKLLPTHTISGSNQFEIWYWVNHAINQIEGTLNTYELNLRDGEWDFASLPSQFKRDHFDGIIVTGIPGKAFLDFLEEVKMPVVVASNLELRSHVDQVCFDYFRAARTAVEAALARGKRQIGFVSPGSQILTHRALFQGYSEAMKEAGCFDDRLVSQSEEYYDHEGSLPDALLKRCSDLEMIFATNPRTAHQVALAAALHSISAPDGLELISLQSERYRELRYRTHVILPDHAELGHSAVNRLMERRDKPELPACTILLQCKLLPEE